MVKGYVRVSTKGQLDNNSIDEQEQAIQNRYSEVEIYKEAFSAAKSTDDRIVFKRVISELKQGDILVVTKLDRFCRNTREGLQVIEDLLGREVSIHILNMGLIDTSPMGRLIVTVLLAFAEFERNMSVERTQAGKAIAKQSCDFKEGRPCKYGEKQIMHAMELLETRSYEQVVKVNGYIQKYFGESKTKNKNNIIKGW